MSAYIDIRALNKNMFSNNLLHKTVFLEIMEDRFSIKLDCNKTKGMNHI